MEFRNTDEAAMGLDESTTAAAPEKTTRKAVTMEKKDAGSEELVSEAAAEALAEAMKVAAKPVSDSKTVNPRRFNVVTDAARDANLTALARKR